MKHLFFLALLAAVGRGMASPLSERSDIMLRDTYANHLQDVWYDRPNGVIYWVHTDVLLKTDLRGKILCQTTVGEHHAGIGLKGGRLYIATCTAASLAGGQAAKDSYVTVGEFDATNLSLVAYHKTLLNDRAGAVAVKGDGTFLVGCLRPLDVTATQVKFHHLDAKFNLIKTYVIDNVPVQMGIETIKIRDGYTYLHVFPVDAAGKALSFDTIKLDANYKEVWRGVMKGDRGIFFDGADRWSGYSDQSSCSGKWRSKLVKNL